MVPNAIDPYENLPVTLPLALRASLITLQHPISVLHCLLSPNLKHTANIHFPQRLGESKRFIHSIINEQGELEWLPKGTRREGQSAEQTSIAKHYLGKTTIHMLY